MPLDTSSTELFSAREQILTLLMSARFSLTPWILLLGDLGRGSLWLLDRFWCTLHGPVLCRERTWAVSRDAALRFCGLSSQKLKNISSLDIFRVGEQPDSQDYCL